MTEKHNHSQDSRTDRRSFLRATAAGAAGLATLSLSAEPVAAHDTYLIREGTSDETTVYVMDSGNSGPTTLVVGGVHGNEYSGLEAAADIRQWNVKQGKLVILPRAAEYAIQNDQRGIDYYSPSDLNRHFPADGSECSSPLAKEIWWDVVDYHDPDLAIDLHASWGNWECDDSYVGQAVFPTATSPARSMGENAIADLNDYYNLTGCAKFTMGNTLDSSGYKLIRRVQGMLGIPGFIMETERSYDLGDQTEWLKYLTEHLMNQMDQYLGIPDDSCSDSPSFTAAKAWTEWQWVETSVYNDFNDPVVVAPSATYYGGNPGHIRLAWINDQNFYHHFEEWEYLDKEHVDEKIHFLMADPGTYELPDCRSAEVGRMQTDYEWTYQEFSAPFDHRPVILATSQTYNESDAITTRVAWADTDGFYAHCQEEEARGTHAEEEVGYIALERGTGEVFGLEGEVGSITTDENWATISFDQYYGTPVFQAGIQTYEGSNTCNVRHRNLSSSSVEVKVEEEQSSDDETGHVDEEIGYVVTELGRV